MAEANTGKKSIQFDLVTPERQVLSQAVEALVFPGAEGSLGVWPGHMPLVLALQPGLLKYRAAGEEVYYAVGGGYAEIRPDKVIVLADSAERAEEINLEAAQRERDRALAQLKKGVRGPESDGAEISLKKALARLQVREIVQRRKI